MTLQDIAEQLGISVSTVSRVFSHHPGIRAEVRAQVLAIAKEKHYHPRLAEKQRNLVVIMPYNATYPVPCCVEMLLLAITRELPTRGFRLEILPMDSIDQLERIRFCGAIALGAEPAAFTNWSHDFIQPLVLVDRYMKPTYANHHLHVVRSDEAQGMELAVDALYKSGCRCIGCVIHGQPGTGNADLRAQAIREALQQRQLPSSDAYVRFADDSEYLEHIGQLLQLGVDALFCPGGSGGILAAHALALYGKKVPDDISLISSEQTFFSRYGTPPQTTITQDYAAVAKATADIIEAKIANEKPPAETVLPYLLIRRRSVACRV